jgi:hypothetical protein
VLWGEGLTYAAIAERLGLGSASAAHQAVNKPVSEVLSGHTSRRSTPRDAALYLGRVTRWNGDCLEWQGPVGTNGYGSLQYAGKKWLAHRLAFVLAGGAIASDEYVCHRCDNRRCVNPRHLFAGTPQDNVRDMWEKGRANPVAPSGEAHHRALLNEEKVRQIRSLVGSGTKASVLASRYGVSTPTIYAVAQRRTWRGVEDAA